MSPETEDKILDLLQLLNSRVARLEQSIEAKGVSSNRSQGCAGAECLSGLSAACQPEEVAQDVSSDACSRPQMCLRGEAADEQATVAHQRLATQENAVDMASTGGPIAEGFQGLGSRALSMKQQVLAAQVQKTDALDDDDEDVSAAKAMADYLQNERKMWLSVKDTQFYKNLCKHKKLGAPVQLRDWLRLLLQMVIPSPERPWDWLYLAVASVMHPSCAVRTRWDVYILVLMLALCLITPYTIGFDLEPSNRSVIGVWEKIVDASFMLDIYFNFRTGYIESEPADFLVTSARTVAVRYIRGFFLIDFLSTVPWDLVLSNNGLGIFQLVKLSKLMKLLRMARALKLVRILRLIKAPMVLKQLENNMGRAYVHILSLACTVIIILHLFACLFHYVTLWDDSNTWVESSGIVDTTSLLDRYLTSMYWAMSTMATVGYGDVTPIQIPEKLVAMVGMLCGVTVFAYVTSTVSSLLTTFNTQNIRTQEQQRNIDGFCRSHQIPKLLARKLSGFYDYVLPRQIHAQDKDIISGLPETLQQQVILTLHAPLFDKLPFFKDKHPQLLQGLLPHLKLEYYMANEHIIWQNDRSSRMFFISDGLVEARINVEVEDATRPMTHDGSVAVGGRPTQSGTQGTRLRRADTKKHADDLWKHAGSIDQRTSYRPRPTTAQRPASKKPTSTVQWEGGGNSSSMLDSSFSITSSMPNSARNSLDDGSRAMPTLPYLTKRNVAVHPLPGSVKKQHSAAIEHAPKPIGESCAVACQAGVQMDNGVLGPVSLQPGSSVSLDPLALYKDGPLKQGSCEIGEKPAGPTCSGQPVAEGTQIDTNRAMQTISRSRRSMPDLHGSVDEDAEMALMHRMIGVSAAPFLRLGRLKRGQHFGERECYLGTNRTVSVVTITASEMYCLQRDALLSAISEWPQLLDDLSLSRETIEAIGSLDESGGPGRSPSARRAGNQGPNSAFLQGFGSPCNQMGSLASTQSLPKAGSTTTNPARSASLPQKDFSTTQPTYSSALPALPNIAEQISRSTTGARSFEDSAGLASPLSAQVGSPMNKQTVAPIKRRPADSCVADKHCAPQDHVGHGPSCSQDLDAVLSGTSTDKAPDAADQNISSGSLQSLQIDSTSELPAPLTNDLLLGTRFEGPGQF